MKARNILIKLKKTLNNLYGKRNNNTRKRSYSQTRQKGFISGTGRRKTAVARIFLYQEKGDITVNGMDIDKYFPSETEKLGWMKPFHAIGISHPAAQFTASIKVVGAGKSAQVGAIAHAISKALSELSEENSITLRKLGMLTRDSRMVERKKYYLRKARKAPQYSKR